ncbi:shikimate dehydrogenase [soil metagenome]
MRLTILTSSYILYENWMMAIYGPVPLKTSATRRGAVYGRIGRQVLQSTDTIAGLLERIVPSDAGRRVLAGLIGRGIQASRTPRMHELEGARLGFPFTYVLVDFDQLAIPDIALPEVIAAAQVKGFAGLNVTHPYKQVVIPLLDALSPEAEAIGAVNTIVFADGRMTGHNTDSWGFAESFRDTMGNVSLESVVQFGAGGAGAAVAYALMDIGVRNLAMVDLDAGRSRALADGLLSRYAGRVRSETDMEYALAATDGIVNTTPVGMRKYPGMPFAPSLLSSRHWVADIIYFPEETELLRRSRALGCRTLPGTGMAIYQAVRAFELFTGRAPDSRAMAEHFGAAA